MIKVFSLIIVYISSFLIFAAAYNPAYALPCSISFPSSADAGSTINIQVAGQANGFFQAVLINQDNVPLVTNSSGADSSGHATITIRLPSEPSSADVSYTIGAWDASIGAGNPQDEACEGRGPIAIGTNIGSCSGFLGCLGGISTPGLNFSSPATFISDLISKILPFVLGIVGFLTVIVIVISGIQFITSSGNPEAAGAARGRLQFALIGFIIVLLAFAITQIVDVIFLGGSGVF